MRRSAVHRVIETNEGSVTKLRAEHCDPHNKAIELTALRAAAHSRTGRLRALAVTTATRSDALPDVPSAAGNRIKIDRWRRRLQIVVSDEPRVADLGRVHGIHTPSSTQNGTERPVNLSSGPWGCPCIS